MAYQISRGAIKKPQKVLIYGTEGVGKTTLAAQFPSPLFIDIEGGSAHMDVNRLPQPTSWQMLMDEVKWIRDNPSECGGTLVLDTLDWAQQLCITHVCSKKDVTSIEDFGYGAGYNMVYEEFGKLINNLEEVKDRGLNVCCLAHAYVGRREIPSEVGLYDCWTTKLDTGKRSNISAMVREWADAVLFCDFKTIVTVTNERSGKAKAQGGSRRIIHTQHAATWDAKNRWGLAEEIPMEYAQIAPYIPIPQFEQAPIEKVPVTQEPVQKLEPTPEPTTHSVKDIDPVTIPFTVYDEPPIEPIEPSEPAESAELTKLRTQIEGVGLTVDIVMRALYAKGYLPEGTPFSALEARQDLQGWIPTVFDSLKAFAKQQGLM